MIRVVCADDSPFLRKVLKDVLEATGKVQVVGEAKNGKEAIEQVKALKPDVLVLDCEMPVMNGLEALRHIMEECPLPVFMFSSLTHEGASVTLKALEYGAVDFLAKPASGAHGLDQVIDELVQKLECVVRRNRFRMGGAKPQQTAVVARPQAAPVTGLVRRQVDLIAIGSSTGGVQAAVELVKRLPTNTRPIVWVQHMPPAFTGSFAARLDSLGTVRVHEAKNGQVLEDNSCYIAPGGFQMRVKRLGAKMTLSIGGTDRVNGFCPSCDPLFDSVTEHYSDNVIGVILTGMGDDGSRGLLKMRQKGAFIIGQSEETCVVYGMPKAAHKIGAVNAEMDLYNISDAIVKLGGGEA